MLIAEGVAVDTEGSSVAKAKQSVKTAPLFLYGVKIRGAINALLPKLQEKVCLLSKNPAITIERTGPIGLIKMGIAKIQGQRY